MPSPENLLVELDVADVFLLHDALLYYAEWSSEDLHERKAHRAAAMRRKLFDALLADYCTAIRPGVMVAA